jgi:hypothetical protein
MDRPRRDIPGIVASAVFIVAGALAIYYSGDFSMLGSVFPRTIAATLIVLSSAYIAVAVFGREAPPAAQPGSVVRRILLAVTLVAWALLLDPLGFLTASIVCYVAILVIANYNRWTPRMTIAYAGVGIVVLGGLYSLFRFALQVPFPAGHFL